MLLVTTPTHPFAYKRPYSRLIGASILNSNKLNCCFFLQNKMHELTPAQKSAMKVARAGQLDRLKELLAGPSVVKDSEKLTAAIRENQWQDTYEHDRKSVRFLVMAAAGGGHPETLRYLLDRYPYPSAFITDEAIINAIQSASVETMQVLADFDPQIPKNCITRLHYGSPLENALWLDRRLDALRMTEFMFKHGADPSFDLSNGGPMAHAILSSWPEPRSAT